MTTEILVGIGVFILIVFMMGTICHLERKLREARHDEMLWELADKALKRDCLMWRKKCLQLEISNKELKLNKWKSQLDPDAFVPSYDVTCLKDDYPDYEDDKCTGTFEYCNQCMVRVIRK